MKNTTKIIIGVLIIVALAFYGGFKYGQSQKSFPGGGQMSRFSGVGMAGQRGSRADVGGGVVAGEILNKDATSITLKLRDGGSRIVLVSGSTEVQKMTKGTLEDLVVGNSVSVNGSTNSDGSLSAKSVQLRTFPLAR